MRRTTARAQQHDRTRARGELTPAGAGAALVDAWWESVLAGDVYEPHPEFALAKREIKDLVVANAIAAGMVAFGGLLTVLVLIYRRINRPTRSGSLLVEALKDLPDSLRGLPDEVATKLKKPLPSIKVVVIAEGKAREQGTLESIARRVAPALVGTASTAVIDRFSRSSEPEDAHLRSTVPAYD